MSHAHYAYMLQQKAQQQISMATQRVRHARTLRDLVTHMNPVLPPEMRAMRGSLPGYNSLRRLAQEKAQTLVQMHYERLDEVARTGDMTALDKALNQLRSQEWVHLRGSLPLIAQQVEEHARKLRVFCAGLAQSSDPESTPPRPRLT